MKKLFLILMLCLCSCLYAQSFKVMDFVNFSMKESKDFDDFCMMQITAVIPYENGYILKLSDSNNVNFECYVAKGFVFYVQSIEIENYKACRIFRKHTITKISPNSFETEAVEYARL